MHASIVDIVSSKGFHIIPFDRSVAPLVWVSLWISRRSQVYRCCLGQISRCEICL